MLMESLRSLHSQFFSLLIYFKIYFRRAKEKRLKKDAGRSRWSQYFRTMKGSISPRNDKDDLKVDLDSNFSHSHGKSL